MSVPPPEVGTRESRTSGKRTPDLYCVCLDTSREKSRNFSFRRQSSWRNWSWVSKTSVYRFSSVPTLHPPAPSTDVCTRQRVSTPYFPCQQQKNGAIHPASAIGTPTFQFDRDSSSTVEVLWRSCRSFLLGLLCVGVSLTPISWEERARSCHSLFGSTTVVCVARKDRMTE